MARDDFMHCSTFWDVDRARPEQGCAPVLLFLPPVVAILVVGCLFLLPLLTRTPSWLSRFAIESSHQGHMQANELPRKRWTHWTALLIAIAASGLIVNVIASIALYQDWLSVLVTSPWILAVLVTVLLRPTSTPISLLVIYASIFITQCAFLASEESLSSSALVFYGSGICLATASIICILNMPMRSPEYTSIGIASSKCIPTSDLRSPEDNISLWQWMSVSWLSPLIKVGSLRQLNEGDVWRLPYEFQHTRLHLLFRDLKGSVLQRLLKANGLDLVILTLIGILELLCQFAGPVLLQQLLRAIETEGKHAAITYAILMCVARLILAQAGVFEIWVSRRAYERSRGEMITMIYEKTLNRKAFNSPTDVEKQPDPEDSQSQEMPKPGRFEGIKATVIEFLGLHKVKKLFSIQRKAEQSKSPASTGKILNLMKNDVYEVSQRFWEFEEIITKPLALIISIVLIWKLLGWPCLIGAACVLLAQTINIVFVRILVRLEKVRRAVTDTRLSVSSQYIESIRHLRWYDWQASWLGRILDARQNELYLRVITGIWLNAVSLSNQLASFLFPVVAFAAYTLLANQPLRVDIAFPALQLFQVLDKSLRDIPKLITVLLNASVALGRINNYMEEPNRQVVDNDSPETASNIRLEDASFSWPGSTNHVLENINVDFTVGISVVCGRVGQGKTALLQAILGELDQTSGNTYRPQEMIGYCTQSPWLQSMSIRENILFSSPYDEHRYKLTLDACALLPDLANFTHGDLSNIGENGIGLSGGQKARVALARAVYSRAKILLLDDPLAALDHDTASYIVQKLFQGSLFDNRTIILVTHRVDLVAHLSGQMLEVSEGQVRSIDRHTISNDLSNHAAHEKENPPRSDEERKNEEADAVPDKFIEDEHRAAGGVVASVYWRYVKAGSLKYWIILAIFVLIQRLLRLFEFYFLKEWGEAYGRSTSALEILSGIFKDLPPPDQNVRPWLLSYLGIALAKVFSNIMVDVMLLVIIYTAGKQLFGDVLSRVSGANFRFYDTTPVGRLMNRLTSDFGTLDGGIGGQLQDFLWCGISWISAMTVIATTTPVFLIFSIILTASFVRIFMNFLPTSQSLRRLEMVSLTPLMTNFGILLDGLATVRAFNAQAQFQNRIIAVTDAFQKMDHFYWSLQAWLMFRFDVIAAFSTLILVLLALYENLSPGLTAFVLTTAANFINNTHWLCRLYGTLQMNFVSVERVIELLDLDQEDVGIIDPPAVWPSYKDDIVFDNVTLKYAEHLPPALQDVTFHIPGGSTTAIVGRTGSGKSTLALALLATIRPEKTNGGKISIGSMDISTVNVHALRQRVTFVAQDPVLFPGTLRQNLDPTTSYNDAECQAVLDRVIKTTHSGTATPSTSPNTSQDMPELTLNTEIATGGKNVSQGQRQLLGLGRAILRRSPVVILDEATASIDSTTATEIQRVLREELQQSTVIMIAHRVEAVRAANWAIALDNGRVAQVGPVDEIIARRFVEQ